MADLDILIKFLLDQQAKAQTEAGIDAIASKMEKAKKTMQGSGFGADFDKAFGDFQKRFDESFKKVDGTLVNTKTGIRATTEEIKAFGLEATEALKKSLALEDVQGPKDFISDMADALDQISAEQEEINQKVQDEIAQRGRLTALYRAQAAVLTNQVAQMRAQAAELTKVSTTIQQFSRVSLVTGVAITGGIFAAANKYVKDAKEATEVTIRWKDAQKDLERSGNRVGAVLAETALPLLERAARLADQASRFVEQHPEIVQAALNTGVVLAALGAVGIAVSKGIKMYADAVYLASVPVQLQAAQLQAKAAAEQLIAAQLKAGIPVSQYGVTGGLIGPAEAGAGAAGGIGALATSPGGIGILLSANLLAAKGLSDNLDKLQSVLNGLKPGAGNVARAGFASIVGATPAGPFLQIVDNMKDVVSGIRRIADRFTGGDSGGRSEGGIGGHKVESDAAPRITQDTMDKALKIYEDYRADDLRLVQEHYADRDKIIQDALNAEQRENARYASQVQKINQNRASSLAEAAQNYQQAQERADIDYQQRRAQIERDGNQEIENIQKDLKERLRKMERDHSERVAELTARRDALGLVKENRSYRQDVNDEKRQAREEIQDRRRAIAQRLEDLRVSYEQERAQRLQDYQQRIAEINAQANEQLKALQESHQAELREIAAQRNAKLRELDAQFVAERTRRYQYFIQQIRDLDASLLGERNTRIAWYQQMQRDLEAFLAQYRATQNAGMVAASTASPGRSAGGWASYGTYTLGDSPGGGPGKKEWIVQGDDAEQIERMIGGQMTPERLLTAVMAGTQRGGDSRSVTYNDARRFDSRISNSDRERLRQDALGVLQEAMG